MSKEDILAHIDVAMCFTTAIRRMLDAMDRSPDHSALKHLADLIRDEIDFLKEAVDEVGQ